MYIDTRMVSGCGNVFFLLRSATADYNFDIVFFQFPLEKN